MQIILERFFTQINKLTFEVYLLNMKHLFLLVLSLLILAGCSQQKDSNSSSNSEDTASKLIPVIIDSDANNELDDQHALAYLFFNNDIFNTVGVTVNATYNGGDIEQHFAEAERVMKLADIQGIIPLFRGADGNFEEIRASLDQPDFDGQPAVEFIIEEARKERGQKLVLLPIGKLTNIALALEKAPDIKENVRIVWLGSNYPAPGEYNQENDIPALNYILNQEVPFEMVMVRYGEPSGSDAVRATPAEIEENMPGAGPEVEPVTGRHGGEFTNFGDYSVDLFSAIDLHGDPPSRALFDMVAVAILKNPEWGEPKEIPAPIVVDEEWQERPDNDRTITIWENFDEEAILENFYSTMKNE